MLNVASYRFLLVGVSTVAILLSSTIMFSPRLPNPFSPEAFATFPGENGKIAFVMSSSGGSYEIYVMNADGSNPTRLTNNVALDLSPSWSPDGKRIAFGSTRDNNANGYEEIYVMNADGSNPTRLTNNPAVDSCPSWSPDGEKIAFASTRDGGGTHQIYVMNAADGSGQTRLTNNPADDLYPSWSPDSTKIAFYSDREGSSGIYVINANDGSIATRLTNGGAHDPDFGTATNTEPQEDTTPPVISAPSDITEEATGPYGAQASFEVSAQDAEDGPVDVSCNHKSGETFPIGETVVTCSAQDSAGNSAEESFTITVQDTTAPHVEITKAIDKKGVEIAERSTTKSHYIQMSFQVTDSVGVDKTECRLDGQTLTPCTSPIVYDQLKKGTHQFTVRSTDAAGNTGQINLAGLSTRQ